jgi:acetolactate synthase-1/2/3 large subunit
LKRLAGLIELPIATTVSGQGAIAETDPLAVGVVGSNGGNRATRAVVDGADVVLFIGCRAGSVTTERWRSPGKDKTIIHIDSDAMVIGANYPTAVAICADARLALAALADALEAETGLTAQDGVRRAKAAWDAKLADFAPLAASNETPIRPERVVATLSGLLDDDAIIVADPGTPCPYFSAHYRWPRAGRNFITNRAHGALGYALAAAMGAHVGRPAVKTVAVMGDGSFGFCCGELKRWCATGCRSPASCFPTPPSAGSRPGRMPASAHASTMSISTAPTIQPWRARSASNHGGSKIPQNWRRFCARRWPMTGRRWST